MKQVYSIVLMITTAVSCNSQTGSDSETEIKRNNTMQGRAMAIRELCQRNQDLIRLFITGLRFENEPPAYIDPLHKALSAVPNSSPLHATSEAEVKKVMIPYLKAQEEVFKQAAIFRKELQADAKYSNTSNAKDFIMQNESYERWIKNAIKNYK